MMNMTRTLMLLAAAALLPQLCQGQNPLQVDFNAPAGAWGAGSASPTQAGWVGVTVASGGMSGIATDFGTIDISFADTNWTFTPATDRNIDWVQFGDPTPVSLPDLTRDVGFSQQLATDSTVEGPFHFRLTGVDPGLYDFTGYFHNRLGRSGSPGEIAVSVDGGSTYTAMVTDLVWSSDTDPISTESFLITATGSDVVFRITAAPGPTAAPPGNALHAINGFELLQVAPAQAIPEPSSVAIWCLAGFGIVGATFIMKRRRAVARR